MTISSTVVSEIDFESLEFELERNRVQKSKKDYVDNKMLYQEFIVYHAKKMKWIEEGAQGKRPPLSDKIGRAIMDIAQRRCYSRNFIGYTESWKQEMVSDAIETCVKYVHNFNPEKSNNPFAYITQLVTNAIINRIKIEHKETYVKYKAFDMCGGFSAIADENASGDNIDSLTELNDVYKDHLTYIAEYEAKLYGPKKGSVEEIPCIEDLGVLEFAD